MRRISWAISRNRSTSSTRARNRALSAGPGGCVPTTRRAVPAIKGLPAGAGLSAGLPLAVRGGSTAGAWVVALEGPSGVGKTTVGRAVARRLSVLWVGEAVDRLRPRPRLTYRSAAQLLALELTLAREDALRWSEADGHRASGASSLLDTGTLGPLAYSWGLRASDPTGPDVVGEVRRHLLGELAERRWGIPDLTIYLAAPEGTVRERVAAARPGHPAALAGRHERVARAEARLYRDRFRRAAPGRFETLDASGPADEVVEEVARRIARGPSGPPPTPTEAAAVLATVRAGPSGRPARAGG